MSVENQLHIPVMLNEVIENLSLKDGGVYVDGTFGNGGYSRAILEKCNTKVIAFDRDENVKKTADVFKEKYKDRFSFFQDKFSNIYPVLSKNNIKSVDGLVLDIGVSSMQIDTPERGFSFRFDAPLSMAMGKNDIDANVVVNTFSEKQLADIFYIYGEEKKSRIIAKNIVEERKYKKIETTFQLVDIINKSVGKFASVKTIPRIFQALRIFVNNELGELQSVLNDAKNILSSGGRLVIVDFHSLEDRIVKNFIKDNTEPKKHYSKYAISSKDNNLLNLPFKIVQKNAIIPTRNEIDNNPRARSAKLRSVERV